MLRWAAITRVRAWWGGVLPDEVWKAHYKYHFCKALEILFLSLDPSHTYTTKTTLLLVTTKYLMPNYSLFVCGVESK